MLNADTQDEAALRLRRIGGQVRGLERMVGGPRLCADLLTQISAVQAALKSVGGGNPALSGTALRARFVFAAAASQRTRASGGAGKTFSQHCKAPRI